MISYDLAQMLIDFGGLAWILVDCDNFELILIDVWWSGLVSVLCLAIWCGRWLLYHSAWIGADLMWHGCWCTFVDLVSFVVDSYDLALIPSLFRVFRRELWLIYNDSALILGCFVDLAWIGIEFLWFGAAFIYSVTLMWILIDLDNFEKILMVLSKFQFSHSYAKNCCKLVLEKYSRFTQTSDILCSDSRHFCGNLL